MPDEQPPSVFRSGGVSYLRIPCRDPSRAADFYEAVFDWNPRRDGDEPAFADATGFRDSEGNLMGLWTAFAGRDADG